MFGLGSGMDPKKMQTMMKQLGMKQEEIPASKVIIEKTNGRRILIENPSVSLISIQGQESFQISGEAHEDSGVSESDLKTVMEKAGVSKEEAMKALKESEGDLADAILRLSE